MFHDHQRAAAGIHPNSPDTIEFQTQAQVEEGFRVCSPPLWRNSSLRNNSLRSRKIDHYTSPLLPHNHHYSSTSPTWRSRAIAEGRKELMEMVQNMPESCFELSLKDMVEEQHILQGEQEEPVDEETSFQFNTEDETKKDKKKTKEINRKGPVSRTGSMDNEVFLIKMFFPSSLGWKKSATLGNSSRVSPRSLFHESERHGSKDGWIKRFFVFKEAEIGEKDSISNSRSSSNSSHSSSNSSRHVSRWFFTSCCPFFQTKSRKTLRHEGCICLNGK